MEQSFENFSGRVDTGYDNGFNSGFDNRHREEQPSFELIKLNHNAFKKMKGNRGYILGIPNATNLTLLMFYSDRCEYCEQAMPELVKLNNVLRQNNLPIQVAICNVGENPQVIQEAQQTVDPIKYVPYMIIYQRDRPYLRYNGKKIAQEMFSYLMEVLKRVDTRQQFVNASQSSQAAAAQDDEESSSAYQSGIPYNMVCQDGMCYLTTEEVHTGRVKTQPCDGDVCYLSQKEIFGQQ